MTFISTTYIFKIGYSLNFRDYSHRRGKEIMQITHEREMQEITSIIQALDSFPHGLEKNKTPKDYIASAFTERSWIDEFEIPLSTGKSDYCDLMKNRIVIEQEYSRFEMFFRDFFRFLLLYEERFIDVAVVITYDDSAFDRWGDGVKSYQSARASLSKLIDFLQGKYASVIRIPIWCIGIE